MWLKYSKGNLHVYMVNMRISTQHIFACIDIHPLVRDSQVTYVSYGHDVRNLQLHFYHIHNDH